MEYTKSSRRNLSPSSILLSACSLSDSETTKATSPNSFLTDSMALHATVKDHIFDNDIIETKTTHNLEASLGFSIYF